MIGVDHRADDHRGRIDVQAQRGDHRGEDQHPEVDAAELHALRDGGHDLVALRLVLVEAETALHKFAQLPEPRRKRRFYLCVSSVRFSSINAFRF